MLDNQVNFESFDIRIAALEKDIEDQKQTKKEIIAEAFDDLWVIAQEKLESKLTAAEMNDLYFTLYKAIS
jgi:hypothetical protein